MTRELTMRNGRVTPAVKLECTRCHGGNSEAPGGALTDWYREDDDPETVVRCEDCGKRHSRSSLVDTNTPLEGQR